MDTLRSSFLLEGDLEFIDFFFESIEYLFDPNLVWYWVPAMEFLSLSREYTDAITFYTWGLVVYGAILVSIVGKFAKSYEVLKNIFLLISSCSAGPLSLIVAAMGGM